MYGGVRLLRDTKSILICSFITTMVLSCAGALQLPINDDGDDNGDASGLNVISPIENQSISSLTYTFTGTCDGTATMTVTPGSSDVTIISSSCTGTTLNIKVGFKAGSGSRSITIELSGSVSESVTRTVTFNKSCPTGFIGVPGNTTLGVSDFCVAKYEMKNVSGVATSQAAGTPWVSIIRTNAITECRALGGNYDMLTNAQWQTIARNTELVDSNWTLGSVGSGCLFRGNVGIDDACGYDAAADPADRSIDTDSKAILTLSNGSEIWDLSGNVWEWVSDPIDGSTLSPSLGAAGWREFTEIPTFFPSSDTGNRTLFGPLTSSYGSAEAVGQLYGGSAGAVLRGGTWVSVTTGGAFVVNLVIGPGTATTSYGFRCAAGL